jgi:D-alanine-D-alanine ligase-like ATP-grasp enzyme
MRALRELRDGKPASYPDQSIYAEYACGHYGLAFRDLDTGTGLLFSVASTKKIVHFGGGRCSWYPQNDSTAATLASDKYFANRILEDAGLATLGGEYFFLNERHRANRPSGHEREDALACFRELNASAFIKPLTGSRGDFAQTVVGESEFREYLVAVSKYYDSILIQPIVKGREYRIFLLDDEVVYCVRKSPPFLFSDGVHSIRELLMTHNDGLLARGLSPIAAKPDGASLDAVLPAGTRWEIPGRMNLSAGGSMEFETPRSHAVLAVARNAARALNLRVAAVDMFTEIDGTADSMAIIEVNSNPSIRFLEESQRDDLILKIWRRTFIAMGLLDV